MINRRTQSSYVLCPRLWLCTSMQEKSMKLQKQKCLNGCFADVGAAGSQWSVQVLNFIAGSWVISIKNNSGFTSDC